MTPDEAVAGASHYSTSPLSPILYGPREGNWTQRDVCLRSPPFCRGRNHPAKLSSFVHHAAAFLCPHPQYDQGKHTKVQHRVTHPSPSHTHHMTCTNNQSHNDMSLSLSRLTSTGRSTRSDKCHEYIDSFEFIVGVFPRQRGAAEIQEV